MAWNALISGGLVQRDIVVGVTLCAMGAEVSSVAAPDSRHVLVMVGALERVIARGMTAHAPRMCSGVRQLPSNSMSKASTPSASVHFRTASNSDTCAGLSIELEDEVVLADGRIFACFSRSILCSKGDWPVLRAEPYIIGMP